MKSINLHDKSWRRREVMLQERTMSFQEILQKAENTRSQLSEWVEELEKKIHCLSEEQSDWEERQSILEERNQSLARMNMELARANSLAAEWMAVVELKEEEIRKLNHSLSYANVRSATLVAEREIQMEELNKLNELLFSEILERKKAEEENRELNERLREANAELEQLATLDTLTELLNRRGLFQRLEKLQLDGTSSPLGVIFADFDDFKRINEVYGHAGGDLMLQEVSQRLKSVFRSTDSLSRIGGDEFLAVLPKVSLSALTSVAERCRELTCTEPVLIQGQPVHVTLSLAAAILPPGVSSLEDILAFTKQALKHSKKQGKNQVTVVRQKELASGVFDSISSGFEA